MLTSSDHIHNFVLVTFLSKLLRIEVAHMIQNGVNDVGITLVAPEGEVCE